MRTTTSRTEPADEARSGNSSAAALTKNAATFALGSSAPDAVLLTRCEGIFEAHESDVARRTNSLGFVAFVVGDRVKHLGVDAFAQGL